MNKGDEPTTDPRINPPFETENEFLRALVQQLYCEQASMLESMRKQNQRWYDVYLEVCRLRERAKESTA